MAHYNQNLSHRLSVEGDLRLSRPCLLTDTFFAGKISTYIIASGDIVRGVFMAIGIFPERIKVKNGVPVEWGGNR